MGRRTVGRGRGRKQQFWCAHDDGRKSLRRRRRSAGSRSDRSTTLRPQNAEQRYVSLSHSAVRSSAFQVVSRILVTTSGELILLPVCDRHAKLNVAQRPRTRGTAIPTFRHRIPAFCTLGV